MNNLLIRINFFVIDLYAGIDKFKENFNKKYLNYNAKYDWIKMYVITSAYTIPNYYIHNMFLGSRL